MAKKTKASSPLSLSYEGFGGIGAKDSHNGAISDLVNLRVCADGSLRKRSGYKAVYSSDKEIRAIWSGYIGGSFECYFLAGRGIYSLDVATGEATLKTSIPQSEGKAQFFYFRDYLYLIDGTNIYRLRDSYAISIKGYVPLFGKDWDAGYPGQINEPLNILHRHARITYKIGESVSAYLPTMYPVATIDALYKNGELVDPALYEFDTRFNTINLSGLATGDKLEANVTFVDAYSKIEPHTDEYIYFRTDHHWTGLGAYYASRFFLDHVGRTYPALDAYRKVEVPGFLGSLYNHTQSPSLRGAPDTVYAYESPTVKELTVFNRHTGEYETIPMIYEADRLTGTWNKYLSFTNGDYAYYEMHNETVKDGSSVLVIRESFGNAFMPMLVDSYEYVYGIDYRFWRDDLATFVEEKGIDTVIFLNNIMATVNDYTIRTMETLVD